jgi:hypothetical protein
MQENGEPTPVADEYLPATQSWQSSFVVTPLALNLPAGHAEHWRPRPPAANAPPSCLEVEA